jgi:thiamine biosynthesis lipoprotein
LRTVAIGDEAIASSGGYGTRFDPAGRNHHLFDRFSGASARYNLGVTVVAPKATTADALSTALSVMPHDRALACLNRFNRAKAIMTMLDGSVVTMQSKASEGAPFC